MVDYTTIRPTPPPPPPSQYTDLRVVEHFCCSINADSWQPISRIGDCVY